MPDAKHTPGPWRMMPQPKPVDVGEYRDAMQDCYVLYGPGGDGSNWVADVFVKVDRTGDLEYMRPSLSYGEIELYLSRDSEDEEGEANARLIAAAPDLLAALQDLVAGLCPDGMVKARAAIAKATEAAQ